MQLDKGFFAMRSRTYWNCWIGQPQVVLLANGAVTPRHTAARLGPVGIGCGVLVELVSEFGRFVLAVWLGRPSASNSMRLSIEHSGDTTLRSAPRTSHGGATKPSAPSIKNRMKTSRIKDRYAPVLGNERTVNAFCEPSRRSSRPCDSDAKPVNSILAQSGSFEPPRKVLCPLFPSVPH